MDKPSAKAAQMPAVVFCIGPERLSQKKVIDRAKAKLLHPDFEFVDGVRLSPPLDDNAPILESLQTQPFGSPYRLVIVEGLKEVGEKTLPWLLAYLEHPNEKGMLLVCADRFERGFEKKLSKFARRVRIERTVRLRGQALKEWIVREASAKGKQLDSDALEQLMRRAGEDLGLLQKAIDAVDLLVGSRSNVTAEEINAIVAPSVQETAFDILDSAGSGDQKRAVEILRQSLAQNRIGIDMFFGAAGWYYRMAYKESCAPASPAAAGYRSAARAAALRRLTKWSPQQFEGAVQELLDLDVSMKQGHPDPELLAHQLLLRLSS